jgi:hypothetical protein
MLRPVIISLAIRPIEITRRLLESFTSGFRRHIERSIDFVPSPHAARNNYKKWYAKENGRNVSAFDQIT